MWKLLVVCFSIISFHGNTQLTNKNEPLSEYVQQDDEKKITKASIVLIGKSVQGFKKLKLAKHNQLGDEKWYKAKPNSKMISTEQFIIEKNGKTCYCANYYGARDEYNSLKAFFEIPSAIVSTILGTNSY